jgi:hypothetical protein
VPVSALEVGCGDGVSVTLKGVGVSDGLVASSVQPTTKSAETIMKDINRLRAESVLVMLPILSSVDKWKLSRCRTFRWAVNLY